jgi:hypothetical protein
VGTGKVKLEERLQRVKPRSLGRSHRRAEAPPFRLGAQAKSPRYFRGSAEHVLYALEESGIALDRLIIRIEGGREFLEEPLLLSG